MVQQDYLEGKFLVFICGVIAVLQIHVLIFLFFFSPQVHDFIKAFQGTVYSLHSGTSFSLRYDSLPSPHSPALLIVFRNLSTISDVLLAYA